MVQSSPPSGNPEDKTPQDRTTEQQRAAEQREREREQREKDQREREQRAADQRAAEQRNPPLDDSKSMVEKAEPPVGEAAKPEPSQAELDEQKERAMRGGDTAEAKERRDMQPGSPGSYRTR